jgi:hypothetical protein
MEVKNNETKNIEGVIKFQWLQELKDLMMEIKNVDERVFRILEVLVDIWKVEQDEALKEKLMRWRDILDFADYYLCEAIERIEKACKAVGEEGEAMEVRSESTEEVINFLWFQELQELIPQVKDIDERLMQIISMLNNLYMTEQDEKLFRCWFELKNAHEYLNESLERMNKVYAELNIL